MPAGRSVPDVPVAVAALLDSTRRLENGLRLWCNLQVSENEVSDVFVDVGNKFHEMMAAFALHNIDMTWELLALKLFPIEIATYVSHFFLCRSINSDSDVSGFLQELRGVLEECLSEDPTPQNVNYLMPQVRSIIASLLVGLKNKQDIYRRVRRAGY